jgi:decaprenylphospho-beta-D-erythro-pentofuranosid-2-ulose 2-reductase
MNDAMGMPQTAVVLGGTSDIASATLRVLVARRLRRVVLAGRDEVGLSATAKELLALGATSVETVLFDVTDAPGHASLARDTATRLGQIDLVLVATGALGEQSADEKDPEAAARILEVNCSGPAAAMMAFADVLQRQGQGHMVVMSSVAGVRVRRANYIYGASKAGLDGFAQGLSAALWGTGVSVMIVRPGWVATRMTAGRRPGMLPTTAERVAADIVTGLERGATVVWSPPVLRWVFAILRVLPDALWRKIPN